ncbi:unnamed protein product, partial [Vitis vinifera]
MEVVAEAVLSVSLEALFSQLGSPDLLKFARQEKIYAELEIWEEKLSEIHEVLNDAEEKQITKKSVKTWLGDLRDLAYDMEDILDEFAYEALRRKAMRNVAAITQSTRERPLTTSRVYEPWVYGRDADKQIIIDMLLRDEPIETNFSVVSIVAMGGMGKTTLARLVYDDAETAKHFDLKAWVCVSDQFDAVRITKTVLNSVSTSQSNTDSLDFHQIQDKLGDELKGKKFLLVLDDMWNDKYDDWRCLQSPFLSGSRGSKIIVTTRSKNVANIMEGDKNLHELQNLSDDKCWSVFKKHAFGNSSIDEHSNLALIGKEIVKKCGGLPLAATALGGLLRHEHREDKWNVILTSKIWHLPSDKCSILPALRLSYNHLPSPLKRCFSYCAIFPKDYEFDKKELIRLWMAETINHNSQPHIISKKARHSSNKVLEGLMPKLWRLRVLSLSGYQISEIPSSIGDLKHLRYLNLSGTRVKWLPDSIGNLYNLETLILSYCSKLIRLPLSIENLNNLRHLDVTDTNLEEMPLRICKLKSLQVLSKFIVGKDNGLNVKELRNMPHLQGELCISNLENVANVQDARDASLNKKQKLEELTIEWSAGLDDSHNARNQIDVLGSLQPHFNLNKLKIENYGGPEFPPWIGDVSFSKMVDVNLVNCRNCTSLPCLGWLPMLKHVRIEGLKEVKIVDWESPTLSEPYPCLLHLKIVDCPKLIKKLPTNLPLSSLSKLRVKDCNEAVLRRCMQLLSGLQQLQTSSCPELVSLGEKEKHEMPSKLQSLTISGCNNLEKLPNGLHRLTCLGELEIYGCPKLVSFPELGFPPMLRRLVIVGCEGLRCLPDWMMLPTTLKQLRIWEYLGLCTTGCENNLKSLSSLALQTLTSLEELWIRCCPKLESFCPREGLPDTLSRLYIKDCPLLKQSKHHSTLSHLYIKQGRGFGNGL